MMILKNNLRRVFASSILVIFSAVIISCGNDDDNSSDDTATTDDDGSTDDSSGTTDDDGGSTAELHGAFAMFDEDNFDITLSGDSVIIESNGFPNHISPYWSNTTERETGGITTAAADENHPLFVEPTVTSFEQMAPGNIDDFNGSFSLTVNADPELASSSSATGLGAIGFAISGAVIYNDEEGPNVPLDNAVGSLDFNGAHTGPQSFHYHLEPVSITNDDSELLGIISDGFFIYGRRCSETGDYPDDLDESGGHIGATEFSDEDEYHYHIQNDIFEVGGDSFYIVFPGDYQGTPSAIQ